MQTCLRMKADMYYFCALEFIILDQTQAMILLKKVAVNLIESAKIPLLARCIL